MDNATESLRWRTAGDERKLSEKMQEVRGATYKVLYFLHDLKDVLSQLNVRTLEVSSAVQTAPRSKGTVHGFNSWLT